MCCVYFLVSLGVRGLMILATQDVSVFIWFLVYVLSLVGEICLAFERKFETFNGELSKYL